MMRMHRALLKFIPSILLLLLLLICACEDETTSATNDPPNIPSNLAPADGATEVDINISLSWQCSDPEGDSLHYELYLDTLNPPSLYREDLTDTVYTISDSLDRETTYYWKVRAIDILEETAESEVQSFSTVRASGLYKVSSILTHDYARGVFKIRDELYVAEGNYGVEIFDVSNQSTPFYMSYYEFLDMYTEDVQVDGTYMYLPDSRNSALLVVDIGNPFIPRTDGYVPLPPEPHAAVVDSDWVYVVCDTADLQIVNVHNPLDPDTVGSLHIQSVLSESIDKVQNYIVLGCLSFGVYIVDISNKEQPVVVGNYNPPGIVEAVFAEEVDGSLFVHIANGSHGYKLIDITDPANPTLVASKNLTGYSYDIWHYGGYSYLASSSSGIYMLDDAIPPNLVASYNSPGQARDLFVTNDYIYVADGSNGVQILEYLP